MRNNFERLGEDQERHIEDVPSSIREEIEGSRNIFGFISSIADLLIPKLLSMMASLLGGNTSKSPDDEDKPNKYPHLDA